ncbi:hypothetical protein Mapa_005777 [Marchantia paleacea]|nr:hypothetical protein Mapa_005777 [Marchantia paleacea]
MEEKHSLACPSWKRYEESHEFALPDSKVQKVYMERPLHKLADQVKRGLELSSSAAPEFYKGPPTVSFWSYGLLPPQVGIHPQT